MHTKTIIVTATIAVLATDAVRVSMANKKIRRLNKRIATVAGYEYGLGYEIGRMAGMDEERRRKLNHSN